MGGSNQLEISKKYVDEEFREKFGELFSLKLILDNAIVKRDYKPKKGLGKSIVLTPEGEK